MIFNGGYGEYTSPGLFLVRSILGITGGEIHEKGTAAFGVRFEITLQDLHAGMLLLNEKPAGDA